MFLYMYIYIYKTVIIDKLDYDAKMNNHLSDQDTYTKIGTNPTNTLMKKGSTWKPVNFLWLFSVSLDVKRLFNCVLQCYALDSRGQAPNTYNKVNVKNRLQTNSIKKLTELYLQSCIFHVQRIPHQTDKRRSHGLTNICGVRRLTMLNFEEIALATPYSGTYMWTIYVVTALPTN